MEVYGAVLQERQKDEENERNSKRRQQEEPKSNELTKRTNQYFSKMPLAREMEKYSTLWEAKTLSVVAVGDT